MAKWNPADKDPLDVVTICCGFDNFSYLLSCSETGLTAVIDPTEAYPVWREVEAAGGELAAVLCTHHHPDHIGGLEDLLAEQPGLAVYGYKGELARIPQITQPLQNGDVVTIGRISGRVLHTPGHTSGSSCFLFGDRLFTGDTLFGAGCGRLFEGTAAEMYTSLNAVIGALPDETLLYFGHEYTEHNLGFAARIEPDNNEISRRLQALRQARAAGKHSTPSLLGLEKATNPFFRCGRASIGNLFPDAGAAASEVEIFSRIRALRNNH